MESSAMFNNTQLSFAFYNLFVVLHDKYAHRWKILPCTSSSALDLTQLQHLPCNTTKLLNLLMQHHNFAFAELFSR